jgi:hypothetical protein
MTAVRRTTAVGVFHDRAKAEEAVAELRQAGFANHQVGLATRQPEGTSSAPVGDHHAEEGGVAGALTGTVGGGLLGVGAVVSGLIPGIGPVISAGLLTAAIAGGAAAGAVAGGLIGVLVGMGIPEEEARQYHQELEAGRTLVTVKADQGYEEAVNILRRCGARGKGSPLI